MRTKEDVEEELGKLPATLKATYAKIYEGIQQSLGDRELATATLSWMIGNDQPLSPEDLVNRVSWACLTAAGKKKTFGLEILLGVCRNLVVLDNESKVIRFSHLSVREFFEENIDVDINKIPAKTCLRLLISPQEQHEDHSGEPRRYATRFWHKHLYACQKDIDLDFSLSRMVEAFLGSHHRPESSYINWVKEVGSDKLPEHKYISEYLDTNPKSPLSALAYFGLEKCTKIWNNEDLEWVDEHGRSLFFIAAFQGHTRVVEFLLSRNANINIRVHLTTNKNPLLAALSRRNLEVLQFMLEKGAKFYSLKFRSILETAVSTNDIQTTKILLENQKQHPISERVLLRAIKSKPSPKVSKIDFLRFILQPCHNIMITDKVFVTLMRNNVLLPMGELIENYTCFEDSVDKAEQQLIWDDESMDPEESIWDYAVQTETIEMLLRHKNNVTEEGLLRILKNCSGNNIGRCMMLLLNCNDISITEEMLVAAIQCMGGEAVWTTAQFLKNSHGLKVTEKALVAAAGNWRYGESLIQLLLGCGRDIMITEKVLEEAARSRTETLKLIFGSGKNTPITENVLVAAAGNEFGNLAATKLLLEYSGDQGAPITENVFVAAAGNSFGDLALTRLLLDHGGKQGIIITEKILVKVVQNFKACEMLQLFLDFGSGCELPVTENVLVAAVSNQYDGPAVTKTLLGLGDTYDVRITETMVIAALESSNEVIHLLLDLADDCNLPVTERVLVAAAEFVDDEKTLQLLLERSHSIAISEVILEAAVKNRLCACEILRMLVEKGHELIITEAILAAAAGNISQGTALITFALSIESSHSTPITEITEKVFVAAASNECQAYAVTKLLLASQGGRNLSITENILVAAVGSETEAFRVVELLLGSRDIDHLPISEKILIAATKSTASRQP